MVRSVLMLVLMLSTGVATAQQKVSLQGKIAKDPTGKQHVVASTSTVLKGGAVDLTSLEGQVLEVRGIWNGRTDAPVVTVTDVKPTSTVFEISGKPRVGQTVTFGATGKPGDALLFYCASEPGFRPAGDMGTAFLGVPGKLVGVARVGPGGSAKVVMRIPDSPELVGTELYGQALQVLRSTGTAASLTQYGRWSNPDRERIGK